jgi:hypothetical protein
MSKLTEYIERLVDTSKIMPEENLVMLLGTASTRYTRAVLLKSPFAEIKCIRDEIHILSLLLMIKEVDANNFIRDAERMERMLDLYKINKG